MLEYFTFHVTPFNHERWARVYLPNDYYESKESYPVFYMQDGHNLFLDKDATYGQCWGLKKYLDASNKRVIVVGIDCNHTGNERLNEYAPWENRDLGMNMFHSKEITGGKGKDYVDFLVNEFKPFIDWKYRTISDDCAIGGSSMGGLISTYAAATYPYIFKKVAALSSAYWFNQHDLESYIQENDLSAIEKFYLSVGSNESTLKITNQRYIDSSRAVYELLKEEVQECFFDIVEGAIHNELAWEERVPTIFDYFYGE